MIRVFWAYRDIPTLSGFIIRGFILNLYRLFLSLFLLTCLFGALEKYTGNGGTRQNQHSLCKISEFQSGALLEQAKL